MTAFTATVQLFYLFREGYKVGVAAKLGMGRVGLRVCLFYLGQQNLKKKPYQFELNKESSTLKTSDEFGRVKQKFPRVGSSSPNICPGQVRLAKTP